jgi:hypothetical protein
MINNNFVIFISYHLRGKRLNNVQDEIITNVLSQFCFDRLNQINYSFTRICDPKVRPRGEVVLQHRSPCLVMQTI